MNLMFQKQNRPAQDLPDIKRFVSLLRIADQHNLEEVRQLFSPHREVVIARAPGRLDVMGGIADYSGSLVLQWPIREATLAAVQTNPQRIIKVVSLGSNSDERAVGFEMPLDEFETGGAADTYERAQRYFRLDSTRSWSAYVAGVFLVLMREKAAYFSKGARILIVSDVPESKGVSSSAAVEVAVMQAVSSTFAIRLTPREMALLCQKVENLIVGAPCGVMDQMAVVSGEANRLLALLCQPAELQRTVAIPNDIAIWGIDSGIRHDVSGADYSSVRIGTFIGYRIIAEEARLAVEVLHDRVSVKDPRWEGYLANVTPSEFDQIYAPALPDRIGGKLFLERYDGTTDRVTNVDPEVDYAVRVPTGHPVYEHARVRAFVEGLLFEASIERRRRLGKLMLESHASYSACGLGSRGTDLLVNLVRRSPPEDGLYGAKITGGGSGGTVAVLGRLGAGPAMERIANQYQEKTGICPYVFTGSSPGAAIFGSLRLQRLRP